MGVAALLATVLHGIEAAIWDTAYRLLGARPDSKSAMLYWLTAMTSYGPREPAKMLNAAATVSALSGGRN